MKLQDNIDFTALNWVKHELDATLKPVSYTHLTLPTICSV